MTGRACEETRLAASVPSLLLLLVHHHGHNAQRYVSGSLFFAPDCALFMIICSRSHTAAPLTKLGVDRDDYQSESEERPAPTRRSRKRKAREMDLIPSAGARKNRASTDSPGHKRARLKGKLSLMMEMPVDIFAEVSYCRCSCFPNMP